MSATVGELASANARLNAEVSELTGELDSLGYSVSHDLQAPVRAVLGYSRAVVDEYGSVLDDEGRRMLGVVQKEAQRLADMIDDLLALSRLGRQGMEHVPVDMTSVARAVAADQIAHGGAPRVGLSVTDLPATIGDPQLLQRLWVNLLSNAVKFSSREAAPQLQVWATRETGGVVYHVRDNGVGFDMRYAARLFRAFQSLHRVGEFPGNAVGLAAAKRIVQRHGGTIWAEAAVGAGATFSFGFSSESDR